MQNGTNSLLDALSQSGKAGLMAPIGDETSFWFSSPLRTPNNRAGWVLCRIMGPASSGVPFGEGYLVEIAHY